MQRLSYLISIFFLTFLLTACGTTPPPGSGMETSYEGGYEEQGNNPDDPSMREDGSGRTIGRPGGQDGPLGPGPNGDIPTEKPAQRVQFDFNSADVTGDYRDIVIQNAKWILANDVSEILVEGYCDERGTREYNLALGQKRADAVKQILTTHGVDWYRIRTISYGKENPLDPGHNAAAWRKNRRADIVIR
ncbi:peptidoglycan-associated lipoprotein Pal [Magnetococcales bacterium HHB-1]